MKVIAKPQQIFPKSVGLFKIFKLECGKFKTDFNPTVPEQFLGLYAVVLECSIRNFFFYYNSSLCLVDQVTKLCSFSMILTTAGLELSKSAFPL